MISVLVCASQVITTCKGTAFFWIDQMFWRFLCFSLKNPILVKDGVWAFCWRILSLKSGELRFFVQL